MATTKTNNYSFLKPGLHDNGWGSAIIQNLDAIDAAIKKVADAKSAPAPVSTEIGTWTPQLVADGYTFGTDISLFNAGHYVKNGKLVTLFSVSSVEIKTGSGDKPLSITGLPFPFATMVCIPIQLIRGFGLSTGLKNYPPNLYLHGTFNNPLRILSQKVDTGVLSEELYTTNNISKSGCLFIISGSYIAK